MKYVRIRTTRDMETWKVCPNLHGLCCLKCEYSSMNFYSIFFYKEKKVWGHWASTLPICLFYYNQSNYLTATQCMYEIYMCQPPTPLPSLPLSRWHFCLVGCVDWSLTFLAGPPPLMEWLRLSRLLLTRSSWFHRATALLCQDKVKDRWRPCTGPALLSNQTRIQGSNSELKHACRRLDERERRTERGYNRRREWGRLGRRAKASWPQC